MPLTGSGQISFNDFRTEVSQSSTQDYQIQEWASGLILSSSTISFAPINVLSSGSRFTEPNPMRPPISMSQWYGYNHTQSIQLNVTGTLYQHFTGSNLITGSGSTMLVINAGTSSMSMSINISGSVPGGNLYIYYGRPWQSNANLTNNPAEITRSLNISNINTTHSFNYNYNASSGSFIYCVLTRNLN